MWKVYKFAAFNLKIGLTLDNKNDSNNNEMKIGVQINRSAIQKVTRVSECCDCNCTQ